MRRMCEGRYELLHTLAFKADADVFLARAKEKRKGEQICVVKRIHTCTDEAKVLRQVHRDPFLVSSSRTISNDVVTLVEMDYFECGTLVNLFTLKRGLEETQMRFYAAELTLAIAALHRKNILHLDIKPSNVMVEKTGHVFLGDFGCSCKKTANGPVQQIKCGTIGYQSPENMQYESADELTDWWGLGVVCCEMLTTRRPFAPETYDEYTVQQAILYDSPELPTNASQECQAFLSRLLSKDNSDRLGSKGWNEVMGHPFFEGLDWDAVKSKSVQPPITPIPLPLPRAVQDKLHPSTSQGSCAIS